METFAVTLFKALADETRLSAVRYLLNKDEISCQELMKKFSLSQPTLSHHFNKLVDAHILKQRRVGVLWFYSIDRDFLTSHGIALETLFTSLAKGGER
jgi:DNA-binding transcriptional ArsR family regulator